MTEDEKALALPVLLNAIDILQGGGWTTGCHALTQHGQVLRDPCDADAVAWSLVGALVLGNGGWARDADGARNAERALWRVTGADDISDWNDAQTSVKPVLAALRRAAEACV